MAQKMVVALVGLVLCHLSFSISTEEMPTVDLGYEIYRASYFNETGAFYNFSNIRYAAPPTGNRRFRAPHLPLTNRSVIQDASIGRVCPQAYPKWFTLEGAFVPDYLSGISFNGSRNLSSYPYIPTPLDPRTTEDCLFLDILVPKMVLEQTSIRKQVDQRTAPVLVWIYGGGYTFGDKTTQTGAPGLIRRSMNDGDDGVIFVAFNYRLGAFGWLAGPEFEKDGNPNAGLLDQQMALQWVQKYIHFFGGDRARVTVFGESAGGGSILHQITAYGGSRGKLPFQQALLQSPGFLPLPDRERQDRTFKRMLDILNVTSVEEARTLPSGELIAGNAYHIGEFSYYGDFTFGPAVDGDFVPALPGQLLMNGRFHNNLRIMVGSNSDEGLLFITPEAVNTSGYELYLTENLPPNLAVSIRQYISDELYPPIFNGSYGYMDGIGRGALTLSDFSFQCNTDYVNRAFGNHTYAYRFSIPPGVHAEDLPYTFYNGPNPAVLNDTVALILQDYITSFAKTGHPVSKIGPIFPLHGENTTVLNIDLDSIFEMRDPAASARCRWWQRGLYA